MRTSSFARAKMGTPLNDKRPYFGEMIVITPVRPNILNFKVPGVIVVISPTPNFQVPGVIKPKMSVVIKPRNSGVIATRPCTSRSTDPVL